MAKQKILTEQEVAFQEMMTAKDELKRVEFLFNCADEEYFEIANMELTLAQMRYKLCAKKLKMVCGEKNSP